MRKKRSFKIVFGLAFAVAVMLDVTQANAGFTLIGTAPSASMSNTRHMASTTLNEYTGAQTFRLNLTWAEADSIYRATGSWEAIADSVNVYVPANLEPILLLDFWNPTKMDKPENARYTDVYKARDIYEFEYACYYLANALKDRVKYFVLHNEPNLFWSDDSGSRNWRNSISDYAIQCTAAAQAIKQAIPDAYVIYGSFAGIPYMANGLQEPAIKQFVDAIAPEGGSDPIIDGIDFHFYGDSLTSEQYRQVADSISAYCGRRNVDWLILETAGPKIALPISMPCPYNPDITILDAIVLMLENGGTFAEVKDSLIVFTRFYDPDNLSLPENISALENAKRADFNRKITAFADSNLAFGPARIFSWFPAFMLPDLPKYFEPLPDSADLDAEMEVFLRGQTYCGSGLIYVDDEGIETPTPLADRMKEVVAIYFPEVSVDDGDDGSLIDQNYLDFMDSVVNYPNPFNSTTEISYYLPFDSEVLIHIYNVLGERIAFFSTGIQKSGLRSVIWDSGNLASGSYFYKLTSGGRTVTGSMMLVK